MTNKVLIIAHRGASHDAPENTIAAFRKAVEDDSDGIEFDVRFTKDRVPVVFHDPTLERITGAETRISDLNLQDLSEIDVGKWFAGSKGNLFDDFLGEGIPTLSHALESLSDFGGLIYVELKVNREGIAALVDAIFPIIGASSLLSQIIVMSFHKETIPNVKKLSRDVRTAALFSKEIAFLLDTDSVLPRMAESVGADFLSIERSLATKNLLDGAKRIGMPVAVWTVDDLETFDQMVSFGVSHIITNCPRNLIDMRDRQI